MKKCVTKNLSELAVTVLSTLVLASCGGGGSTANSTPAVSVPTTPPTSPCTGFGNWETSAYVLPYPVGKSYRLNQGNCSGFGHSDFWQYGYDFEMPIGSLVSAARSGTVVHTQDGARDGDRNRTNLITIEHDDLSVALYSHLTLNGVQATEGQVVFAGDVIGQSGDTGNTGGLPHLHFSIHPCRELPGLPGTGNCPTAPANFRNTRANPVGLAPGFDYLAEPF